MQPLLCLQALTKQFSSGGGFASRDTTVFAVRGVDLAITKGETLGIVGESGCGKSTLGRMAVGLMPPTSGEVRINGLSIYDAGAHKNYAAFRKSLAGVIQMVFQDPYSSLNPRMRIADSIAEPLTCGCGHAVAVLQGQEKRRRFAIRELVDDMLVRVGLDAAAGQRYPHEFSGGQRQRIAIARALVTRPSFVVCDEPTSSLDASVQSQILNLLRDMQDSLGLTYCFISHDLGVVRHMSDRVAVMYAGLVVEEGDAERLFATPAHPYTRLLLASVPGSRAEALEPVSEREQLSPGVQWTGQGCPFAPRCPYMLQECLDAVPDLSPVMDSTAHTARCILSNGGRSV